MATDGKSLLLIGKTLNHKSTLSTEAYAHLAPDPVRDSLEEHAEQIMEAAKGIRRVK